MCRFFQWADEQPANEETQIPSPRYFPEKQMSSKEDKPSYTPRPKLQRQFAVTEK